jgi:ABC-type lipoprotein release transport system permease subunit
LALPLSYNLRNLRVRWPVTLLAVFGIALVVAVFVFLAAMSNGFRIALRATGRPDNAIIVQKGSPTELGSSIDRAQASLMLLDPRIARGTGGRPLVSGEIVVVASLTRKIDGGEVNVLIRGVSRETLDVRGGVRMVRGRLFSPGLTEVIVGARTCERFGLDLGSKVPLGSQDWDVVGVFDSEGSSFESEIWGDISAMSDPLRRQGAYQTIVVRLADPLDLASFKAQYENNPQVQVAIGQERRFYEDQAGPTSGALMGLAIFVSVLMGIGAVFGAMNTMYAIVASRTREIGTLRALGFSRRSILVAFMTESTILALVGGGLGCILALPANGVTAATSGSNFSELAFAFRVTPPALGAGLGFAVIMGLIGGFLPAFRAARLPITGALRD